MEAQWSLDQLLSFMNSWSATQRYRNEQGHSPVAVIWDELQSAWGDPGATHPVRWPLAVRIGTK
jgi:hypothetical protein